MNRQRGFIGSLIELLVFVIILVVIAGIIIPTFTDEKRTADCQAQVDAEEIDSFEDCTIEEVKFKVSININSTPTNEQSIPVNEESVVVNEEGVTNIETLCLDAVEYWVVTMNGRQLLAPHQNRWGDNIRCTENEN